MEVNEVINDLPKGLWNWYPFLLGFVRIGVSADDYLPGEEMAIRYAALEAIAYGLSVIMFFDLEGADELNADEVTCFAEDYINYYKYRLKVLNNCVWM